VLTTASPLVLAQADQVVFLQDGSVAATGKHRELLHSSPSYRETVTRGEGL
jgi:ABC-type transport system involved in cytochrome bd biosynthesis fused ATPase/permease subunit